MECSRLERIIREDVIDLSRVIEVGQLETLASLLPERVGTLTGRASLRETLEIAFATLERWLRVFEELYVCFRIKPYTKSITRSLRKETKLYLWDILPIADLGARFENLVALHLLKACDYWTDSGYGDFALWYLRDKDKREVDFLITKDGKAWAAFEAKREETHPTANFKAFSNVLSSCQLVCQVIERGSYYRWHEFPEGKVLVVSAADIFDAMI